MALFVSPRNRKMKIWGDVTVNNKRTHVLLASFEPDGRFTTDDQELIEKLKNHSAYGTGRNKFTMINTIPKPKGNVIQGIRSGGTQPVFDEKEKLIRLGALRAKLLKKDGSFRKDASEEEINELKSIQEELGV